MYKLKLIAITAIAVIGALLIYNHFDNIKKEKIEIDKFSTEYNLVSENNVFNYSSLDEILDVLENKTGFVFFCTPESTWCNYYAANLNQVLIDNNINNVYYYNIRRDRDLNTIKYQRILDILSPYIFKDDSNNTKIYMPDLTVVKDGVIVAHDNETSLIASDIESSAYWTNEKQSEFRNKITDYVKLINE